MNKLVPVCVIEIAVNTPKRDESAAVRCFVCFGLGAVAPLGWLGCWYIRRNAAKTTTSGQCQIACYSFDLDPKPNGVDA